MCDILALWPARRDLLADARVANPDLELVAVHRWFQRNRVPAKYHTALVAGAGRRGLDVTHAKLAEAHSQPMLTDTDMRRSA